MKVTLNKTNYYIYKLRLKKTKFLKKYNYIKKKI